MTPSLTKQPELSTKAKHGRAINAIANFFRAKLSVPNIYLLPSINRLHMDLLAIDRAGSGDVHAVEVKLRSTASLEPYLATLNSWPAHFRYLALPTSLTLGAVRRNAALFSPDGIGRIGILRLNERTDSLPDVDLYIEPERFRVPSLGMDKIDKFIARTRPDISVRIESF